MARNSSGTYSRTQSDYTFNTVIQETQINSELNDIATELTASLEASGKKTWTGNQNAGSTKVTALAVGTANADSTTLGQVQNSGMQYATGSGTDTIVATMAPAITAYVAGQTFRIKQAAGANTGATTLNLNSLGAKNITKKGTTALAAGDIPASAMFEVAYDGTQFQLLNVGTDVGITATESVALTNKTIDLGSNTVTGSLAEFNTALQSESFCSLTGSETLTNKTMTSAILNSPAINDPAFDVSVGNTANTGSAQGNNPITSFLYEIATCANAGDAVTLPAASAGLMVIVVNNGAESADVFPASGDKIDGGSTNAAYALASATNTIFICQDATDWDTVSGGGGTSNMVVDTMTGDGSDTTLALSQDPGSENNVTVTLDGVTQHHDTFSVSGTALTFSTAPAVGVSVEAVSGAASTIGVPDDSSVSTAKIANNAVDETKLKDALVADFTEVVVTASDSILLGDATDSGNTKRDTIQGVLDLVPSGADTSLSNLTAAGGQQVVKVWINFNGTGTVAIRDSYNVTSITDNATGDYSVTIDTDFANVNYCIAAPAAFIAAGAPQHHTVFNRINSSGAESAPTVSAFRMTTSMDGVSTDAKYVYASAFGD